MTKESIPRILNKEALRLVFGQGVASKVRLYEADEPTLAKAAWRKAYPERGYPSDAFLHLDYAITCLAHQGIDAIEARRQVLEAKIAGLRSQLPKEKQADFDTVHGQLVAAWQRSRTSLALRLLSTHELMPTDIEATFTKEGKVEGIVKPQRRSGTPDKKLIVVTGSRLSERTLDRLLIKKPEPQVLPQPITNLPTREATRPEEEIGEPMGTENAKPRTYENLNILLDGLADKLPTEARILGFFKKRIPIPAISRLFERWQDQTLEPIRVATFRQYLEQQYLLKQKTAPKTHEALESREQVALAEGVTWKDVYTTAWTALRNGQVASYTDLLSYLLTDNTLLITTPLGESAFIPPSLDLPMVPVGTKVESDIPLIVLLSQVEEVIGAIEREGVPMGIWKRRGTTYVRDTEYGATTLRVILGPKHQVIGFSMTQTRDLQGWSHTEAFAIRMIVQEQEMEASVTVGNRTLSLTVPPLGQRPRWPKSLVDELTLLYYSALNVMGSEGVIRATATEYVCLRRGNLIPIAYSATSTPGLFQETQLGALPRETQSVRDLRPFFSWIDLALKAADPRVIQNPIRAATLSQDPRAEALDAELRRKRD